MRAPMTLTNKQTGETHTAIMVVRECPGGYTADVNDPPDPARVYPTIEEVLAVSTAIAQELYDEKLDNLVQDDRPRCHYCGQPVAPGARPNLLGAYECRECQ